jgi:hypothetical protein
MDVMPGRSPDCTIIKNEAGKKLGVSEHHCPAAVDFAWLGLDLLRMPQE